MQEGKFWMSLRGYLKERAMSSKLSGGNEENYVKSYSLKSVPRPRFE